MATLTETEAAYDRHQLHVGALHSDVADVIMRLEAERDAARAELRTRTRDFTRLIEEAQALMRPQGEWEQEVEELRASAGLALARWRRSEVIRRSALNDLTTFEELARDLVASLHGDGNGRCWCGAREADRLRSFLERAALAKEGGA